MNMLYMKSVLLAVCVLLLVQSLAFAGLLGPAQPTGKKGEFSFGPGLVVYSGELDNDLDFQQTQVYAQLGYALTDKAEIYLQGGAADLTVDDLFGSDDFEDGFRPFGAFGFKALLTDRKPLGIGVFAQGTIFSDYDDQRAVGGIPTKVEFTSAFEVVGGVVLQSVLDGAILYGGPYFFTREGDVDFTIGPLQGSGSFEEDGNLGAFIGMRWPLRNGINVDLEGHLRTDFSIGADILYNF
jgi:hypothetical protein